MIYLMQNTKLLKDLEKITCYVGTTMLAFDVLEGHQMTTFFPASIFVSSIVMQCNSQVTNKIWIRPHVTCEAYARNCCLSKIWISMWNNDVLKLTCISSVRDCISCSKASKIAFVSLVQWEMSEYSISALRYSKSLWSSLFSITLID